MSAHEINGTIERAHAYLEEQRENASEPQFNVMLASQARSLKMQIERRGDITESVATELLAQVRYGPWTPMQINSLSASLDTAVQRSQKCVIMHTDRKPQSCENPEVFWSDAMWERTMDPNAPRSRRISDVVSFLMSMDLTNPDPQCKQRIVAMLALGDSWIQANPTNAKVALDELSAALKKFRPAQTTDSRPHLREFPKTPADAINVIDGFVERVYGEGGTPSVDPPFSTADIDTYVRTFVLRWTHKNVRSDAAPHSGAASSGYAGGSAVALCRRPTRPMQIDLHDDNVPNPMQMMQNMHQQTMHMMQGMQETMQGFGRVLEQFAGQRGVGLPPQNAPQVYPQGKRALEAPVEHHTGRRPRVLPLADGAAVASPQPATSAGATANDDDAADVAAAADEADELDGLAAALAKSKPKAKAKAAADTLKRPAGCGGVGRPPAAGTAGMAKRPAGAGTPPSWGYENSRNQIMCRTGIPGPGQSHGIKYDEAGGKAKAIKLADAWVKAKKLELGFS